MPFLPGGSHLKYTPVTLCLTTDSHEGALNAPLAMRTPGIAGTLSRSWSAVWRAGLVAIGTLLIIVGFVGALLPGHLGVPLLVIGLIMVLRTSRPARRHFIGLQRRHPKVVFPIRRLLRREPEVFPVAWQQVLRIERMLLPKSWRVAKVARKRLRRPRVRV